MSSTLDLHDVLYVPKFPVSLLSISQLTKHFNCSVTFFPSCYVFQDLAIEMRICSGHECRDYLLEFSHINSQDPSHGTCFLHWSVKQHSFLLRQVTKISPIYVQKPVLSSRSQAYPESKIASSPSDSTGPAIPVASSEKSSITHLCDLNVPIAFHKGKRSIIAHSVSYFVSFDHVTFSFHTSTLSLASVSV